VTDNVIHSNPALFSPETAAKVTMISKLSQKFTTFLANARYTRTLQSQHTSAITDDKGNEPRYSEGAQKHFVVFGSSFRPPKMATWKAHLHTHRELNIDILGPSSKPSEGR
jgi:hypothetical protein